MQRFRSAVVRVPCKNLFQGLSANPASHEPIDFPLAITQHQEYIAALKTSGCAVTVLPPKEAFPDSCFVEDTAVCLPNNTVIYTRPGTSSRAGEVDEIKTELSKSHFKNDEYFQIKAPGTLEGGDVMQVKNHFFIGLSSRTNEEGAVQLLRHIESTTAHSASLLPVSPNILHLKTQVTYVGFDTMLMTSECDSELFKTFEQIGLALKVIEDSLDFPAVNCININDSILVASGFPKVQSLLPKHKIIIPVPTSEIHKVDGGLTCLSLRF